jgi:plastocyanin
VRTPLIAAVLAACALAIASCGDDDSEDTGNGGGGGGNAAENGGGGGGIYGGGGGGDDDGDADGGGGDAGGATALRLTADPNGDLAFDKKSLSANAGRVVIAFDNTSGVPHAVEVEGNGVEEETETITDGSERLSLNLDPGEYRFYCPVGNHEDAGMVGTLTVR